MCLLNIENYNESFEAFLEYMIEDENIMEGNCLKDAKKIQKIENLTLLADIFTISGKFKRSLKYEELLYKKTNDSKYLISQLKCHFRMKNLKDSLKTLEILLILDEIDPLIKKKAHVDKIMIQFFILIFELYERKRKIGLSLLSESLLNLDLESEGILIRNYEVEFFKGVNYFYKNDFFKAVACFENALSIYEKRLDKEKKEKANKWDENKNSTLDFGEMNFNIAIASIQVAKEKNLKITLYF